MNSFAIFRLPHARKCTMIEGETVVVPTLGDLDGEQGFLLAPFAPSAKEPILLIKPDKIETTPPGSNATLNPPSGFAASLVEETSTLHPPQETYSRDFRNFHRVLLDGQFQKLVLARCAAIEHDGSVKPMELFEKACQLYPRMFVSLVSTPQSGTWLTASPEILLESLPPSGGGEEGLWRTIALAGTMRLRSDKADDEGQRLRWSAKNIQEQRYVASYLACVLRHYSDDVLEEGPRTVRAGHLVHLRSDFTFHIKKCTRVGGLLEALHPTPAVCGLPKNEAQHFIVNNEHSPRHYYSGFMGPFHLPLSTHLYVSLRCMNITERTYCLYAGGGLLPESIVQQEWQETEAKMETMRHLIH